MHFQFLLLIFMFIYYQTPSIAKTIIIFDKDELIDENTDFSKYTFKKMSPEKANTLYHNFEHEDRLTEPQKDQIHDICENSGNKIANLKLHNNISKNNFINMSLLDACKIMGRKHKYFLLTAAGLCVYSYIWWNISSLSKVVSKTDTWSCWKQEIPLEVFLDKDMQDVKAALCESILQKYPNSSDKLFDSLLLFQKAVHEEFKELQQFINYYQFLKTIFLSYLFPNYETEYNSAHDKIDRLLYLEQLVENNITEKYTL